MSLIKLIYNLAPAAFNKAAFEARQGPEDWRQYCEVGFVDEDGTKYWRYMPDYKMPIKRMAYIDTLKVQYLQAWSQQDQNLYDDKLKDLFERLERGEGFKQYYKLLADLRGLLDEKDNRRNMIIQVDILTEMVACFLIREDESPFEVNERILQEKVQTFKKKVNFQFLKQQSILEWMGLSQITDEQFDKLLEYSTQIQAKKKERLSKSRSSITSE